MIWTIFPMKSLPWHPRTFYFSCRGRSAPPLLSKAWLRTTFPTSPSVPLLLSSTEQLSSCNSLEHEINVDFLPQNLGRLAVRPVGGQVCWRGVHPYQPVGAMFGQDRRQSELARGTAEVQTGIQKRQLSSRGSGQQGRRSVWLDWNRSSATNSHVSIYR